MTSNNLTLNDNNPFDFSEFKNILGLIGNILAISFFASPISEMRKLHKKEQNPNDTPYLIFVMSILNCAIWISYGILKTDDKFFLLLANGIGYPLNLIYLCLYFYYRNDRECAKSSLYIFPSILISLGIIALFTWGINVIVVSQYTAMTFNVLMFAAPGQNIVRKIK
jgi:hypothetical protein